MSNVVVDKHEHTTHEADHAHDHAHDLRDDYGAKMGMWLFLFTEVLLFGGLFFMYFQYRVHYSVDFHEAAKELNPFLGTMNTIILLTSSLTMALSIAALQRGNKKLSLLHLGFTIACAFGFLINKYFEWSAKIHHGIYPGSETLQERPEGQVVFFGLYYLMTGLHTFHVIVGIIVLAFMMAFIKSGHLHSTYYSKLENGGLYWHLVDLIWIFLFPLFYLLH